MPTVRELFGKFHLRTLALAACFGLGSEPAAAASASFSIPIFSVQVGGSASTTSFLLRLPNGGTPSFAINFMLPRDYAQDTDVKIALHLSGFPGDCNVRFRIPEALRTRARARLADAEDAISTDGWTAHLPRSGAAGQKVFTLRSGGSLADLKAGDSFIVLFERGDGHATDTCTSDVVITGIDVRYDSEP